MTNFKYFLIPLLLVACTSKQDKMAAELSLVDQKLESSMNFEKYVDSLKAKNNGKLVREKLDSITQNKLQQLKAKAIEDLYSIPDSLVKKMRDFAVAFPQYPKSEQYLYRATQLAEKGGRFFETAKWCEEYLKYYPKGRFRNEALLAAAVNFEKCGTVDKAIEYYEKCAAEFPDATVAKQSKQSVALLKKGLVTPEQQLEYLIQHADTTAEAKK